MKNILLSESGSESVEFAMSMPAIIALGSAVLGVLVFSIRELTVAFAASRAARVAEVYQMSSMSGEIERLSGIAGMQIRLDADNAGEKKISICSKLSSLTREGQLKNVSVCRGRDFIPSMPSAFPLESARDGDSPVCIRDGGVPCEM